MNYNFCVDASMGRTDAEQFTMTWFYRALACSDKIDASSPNAGQRRIDLGDRFMSLWICFINKRDGKPFQMPYRIRTGI